MTKIVNKTYLMDVLHAWQEASDVYVPQKQAGYSQFQLLTDESEITLEEPHNTRYPPKAFFLPQSETLMTFQRATGQLQTAPLTVRRRIIFGIRPCDAKAVTLLDTVFDSSESPDPYWKERREQTMLIGLGCSHPCPTCFCTTVGSGPFDAAGLDALLTDLGEAWLVEPLSDKGRQLMEGLPEANMEEINSAGSVQAQALHEIQPAFETIGLKKHLDQIFDTKVWDQFAASCLGCGICTFLCPTCFCFDIVDEVQRGSRVRNWGTCMFRVYSQEASGHNPRPSRRERTRQRLMHKYSYWLDQIDEIGCTGCGRCIRYCPVGLDIRAMLRQAGTYESEVAHAG